MPVINPPLPPKEDKPNPIVRVIKWPFQKLWDKVFGRMC